jgi:hypothetical protein
MASPAVASDPPVGSFTFATRLTNVRDHVPGGYEGVLNLTISSDGTVRGTYRAVDRGTERAVIGGLKGQNLWLEVGGNDSFHIEQRSLMGKSQAIPSFRDAATGNTNSMRTPFRSSSNVGITQV